MKLSPRCDQDLKRMPYPTHQMIKVALGIQIMVH